MNRKVFELMLFNRILRANYSSSVRLVALVLLAVLPVIALIWINAVSERQRAVDVAGQQVLALAEVAAEQENDTIQEAENLLRVLARVPAVINASPERCHSLLMNVTDDHPKITSITVTDQSGEALCNSQDEQPAFNLSDRAYFRQLMSKDPLDFALSELLIGKRLGKPTIVAAVPLKEFSPNGLPKGIVAASISLYVGQRLDQPQRLKDRHTVVVFDVRDGTLLASSSNDASTIGRKFPDHPLIRAFRDAPGGGVVNAQDFSGVPQIFGFTSLPGTSGNMVVAVGLTEQSVLGAANRHFAFSLWAAVGVAGVAMVLALLAARSWLLRPGAAIVAAVEAFGMGNMSKRIPTGSITLVEFKKVANTFNAMADAIEEQDQNLDFARREIEEANIELDRVAHTDALTGLANRRRFDRTLDIEWRRAIREFEPLGLLMIDLDRFKAYNDTFGHPAGDECLRLVANAVSKAVSRAGDLVARYGGEEIVVILPNTGSQGTAFIGERVAAAIRALCLPHPANPGHVVTISVGAASCMPSKVDALAPYLLTRADKALYEAKNAGRDQVWLAADEADVRAMQTVTPEIYKGPLRTSQG